MAEQRVELAQNKGRNRACTMKTYRLSVPQCPWTGKFIIEGEDTPPTKVITWWQNIRRGRENPVTRLSIS